MFDKLIKAAHKQNERFQQRFAEIFDLSKQALNPNISRDAVDEMLLQHLLTERLSRRVFDNPDLGNRSAMEWVVDQYRIKTEKRSGITHDPNNPAAPKYIVELLQGVITVSLAMVQVVNALPEAFE